MIVGSLLFSVIAIPGFIPPIAKWIDGADNLYALPVSEARNDGRIHDKLFANAISRASFMVVTSNPPGYNVLTWKALQAAEELDQIAQGLRVDPAGRLVALPATPKYYREFYSKNNHSRTSDKKFLTYGDICAPDPVTRCKVQSIFEMGVKDMKLQLPEGAEPELYIFDGLVFNLKRKGFAPSVVLGGIVKEPCTRELPVALISQIYDSDRYTESRPGYATADMECITEVKGEVCMDTRLS